MANNRVKKTSRKKYLFLLLLFIATMSMAIGYASLFGVLLTIDGSATVLTQDVIHISAALYSSNNGADINNSSINDFYATTLNSTITLGSSSSSTITYSITITNDTNDDCVYTGYSYDAPDFYDNTNITFDVNNLNVGDVLTSGSSKTFTITFRYTGNNTSNPVLNSYISFDFDKYYTITYEHINTSGQNYPTFITQSETSKTITFSGDVPYDVEITPSITYTYNNGVLTISNVTSNIVIDRYYSITYVTSGTNAQNQPDKYLHGATVTFLNPTNGNDIFDGWYTNQSYTGNPVVDTNGLSGDLTLYAKWTPYPYEVATTYIASLVGSASTSSTNIITLAAPTGASCTNTLAYDGTSDANLRYVGADPCNYVNINCDSNNNCELWRIVGVMNGVDTNSVLKLVKNDNTTSARWHSKNNNTWTSAELYNTLNTTFLNSLNSGVSSDYLLNTQWRIGALSNSSTPSNAYTSEKGTMSTAAYIGLINPTDYAYATSGTSDSTRNTCITSSMSSSSGVSSTCYNNNYLYISGQNQWTINKSSNGNSVIYITNVGLTQRQNPTSSYRYRPTVYIKSTVKINTQSGDGSQNNPYQLHVD